MEASFAVIEPEDLVGHEWAEWYRLTPAQRWSESEKLWHAYLALGGSLDPEPDTQVLSSMRGHRVRCLLMGGQACVFYGAAERPDDVVVPKSEARLHGRRQFSRDTDLAILAGKKILSRLRTALDELQAEVIAVPDFGPTARSGKIAAAPADRGITRDFMT